MTNLAPVTTWKTGDPEPEGVTCVEDRDGDEWTKTGDEWAFRELAPRGWEALVHAYGPLTIGPFGHRIAELESQLAEQHAQNERLTGDHAKLGQDYVRVMAERDAHLAALGRYDGQAWDTLIAERDQARGYAEARDITVAGLRKELVEATETMGDYQLAVRAAEAERDEARAERDEVLARTPADYWRIRSARVEAERDAMREELGRMNVWLAATEADRDRIRPVVEAAEAFAASWWKPSSPNRRVLIAAVDAWRAAQPGDTSGDAEAHEPASGPPQRLLTNANGGNEPEPAKPATVRAFDPTTGTQPLPEVDESSYPPGATPLPVGSAEEPGSPHLAAAVEAAISAVEAARGEVKAARADSEPRDLMAALKAKLQQLRAEREAS